MGRVEIRDLVVREREELKKRKKKRNRKKEEREGLLIDT